MIDGNPPLQYLKEKIASILVDDQDTSVYLFGSYARDEQNGNSDVDMLVVTKDNDEHATLLVQMLYRQLIDYAIDYDILGYSQPTIMKRLPKQKFFQNVLREGKIIHGRGISGMVEHS